MYVCCRLFLLDPSFSVFPFAWVGVFLNTLNAVAAPSALMKRHFKSLQLEHCNSKPSFMVVSVFQKTVT